MSAELKITGTIKEFLTVESGTTQAGKEWKKQNFVISNNDGYQGAEQLYCFEVFGEEKVDNLNKFNKVGQEVDVNFNVSCREWKGKYYTNLQAWLIKSVVSAGISESLIEPVAIEEEIEDDLPF